jgi:hypothetical protein
MPVGMCHLSKQATDFDEMSCWSVHTLRSPSEVNLLHVGSAQATLYRNRILNFIFTSDKTAYLGLLNV